MQIFFFSKALTIALYFIVWTAIQLGCAFLCLRLPARFFRPDAFFWRAHRWEKAGRVYDDVFRVRAWKRLLPDGGAAFHKRGYRKKNLTDYSEPNLERFLVESARGELTHWLAILPFWVFGLFSPPLVVWLMLAYTLAVNVPCIIAQRYNRPRVLAVLARIRGKKQPEEESVH